MNLLIEYYKPDNLLRHGENLACLLENIENEYLETIYLFVQKDIPTFTHPKIKLVVRDSRPTFKDYLEFCNNSVKEGICIVANSDIIFDKTIASLGYMESTDFVALTRWDIQADGSVKFMNSAVSQDTWVFKAPVKITPQMDFPMIWGRDNKIAYVVNQAGYKVSNPSKEIITRHLHISNYRSITKKDVLRGPFLGILPSDLVSRPQYFLIKEFNDFGQPL